MSTPSKSVCSLFCNNFPVIPSRLAGSSCQIHGCRKTKKAKGHQAITKPQHELTKQRKISEVFFHRGKPVWLAKYITYYPGVKLKICWQVVKSSTQLQNESFPVPRECKQQRGLRPRKRHLQINIRAVVPICCFLFAFCNVDKLR